MHSKVTLSVHFMSWCLPALALTALPSDISTAFFDYFTSHENLKGTKKIICRPPLFYVDSQTRVVFWYFVYWISQFLTWILIPILRSYSRAGDFSILLKFKSAIIDNAVYYAVYFVIFIVTLCYLLFIRAISFDLYYLKILLITTSNTWGLFLVIIFLGYGLVEVPRSLWAAGNVQLSLRLAYNQISQTNLEFLEEEEALTSLLQRIDFIVSRVPSDHPYYCFVRIICEQAQLGYKPQICKNYVCDGENEVKISAIKLKDLVLLHKSLKRAQHNCSRAQCLYDEAVKYGKWIEDVNDYRRRNLLTGLSRGQERCINHVLSSSLLSTGAVLSKLYRYWCCYVRFYMLRVFGMIFALMSCLVVWSECLFFIDSPVLSAVAKLIQFEAMKRDFVILEITAFSILGYLSFAVFYAVSRFRLFNYYRLVGNHHTDENSLLFSGALLCRLIPSLCLNFLGLAQLDNHLTKVSRSHYVHPIQHDTEASTLSNSTNDFSVSFRDIQTSYTRFMGHLDVIPFISRGFNIYFPMLVLFLCLATYFRLGNRLFYSIGLIQFLDTSGVAGDGSSSSSLMDDSIQDGKLILRKERMDLTRSDPPNDDRFLRNHRHSYPARFKLNKKNDGKIELDRLALLSKTTEISTSINAEQHDNQTSIEMNNLSPVEYNEESIEEKFTIRFL